ncbi:MAG: peptidylprolyl isomerase [Clostridium sp.]|nr:peptidylprolyl isomerase [Clostridium sp.]
MIKKFIMACGIALGLMACSKSSAEATTAEAAADSTSIEMATDTASVKVAVKTTLGDFTILLYGDTPGHRDNFVKHVKENYYDSLLFHRVIEGFMVQAGDPDSKNAKPGQMLGSGDPGYTLPAEIVYPKHFHKRGALAAARTGDQVNPERRSSGSQFYVVTGEKLTEEQMKNMQLSMAFNQLAQEHMDEARRLMRERDNAGLQKLEEEIKAQAMKQVEEGKSPVTAEMIEAYTTVGGTPHLDGQYTVFGEVLSGMDTIEKIEKARTGQADRPVEDIRILSMKIID